MFLAAVIFAAGLALLVYSRHAQHVGYQPRCRECGFDLRALPPDSRNCSECGANIESRQAVQRGRRVSWRPGMWMGCALLLASAVVPGITAWKSGVNSLKFSWWLLIEAQSRDMRARDAALTELMSRAEASDLSRGSLDALIARLLSLQADGQQQWKPAWGDAIEQMFERKELSTTQHEQYIRQIFVPQFKFEWINTGRADSGLYVWIADPKQRQGTVGQFYANCEMHRVWINGIEEDVSGLKSLSTLRVSNTFELPCDVRSTVMVHVFVPKSCKRDLVYDVDSVGMWRTQGLFVPPPEVRKNGASSAVTLKSTRDGEVNLRQAITVSPVLVVEGESRPGFRGRWTIQINDCRVALACKVYVQTEGGEYQAESIVFNPPEPAQISAANDIVVLSVPFFEEKHNNRAVSIVLRPDTELAAAMKMPEIWGEEIIFKNVAVVWPDDDQKP